MIKLLCVVLVVLLLYCDVNCKAVFRSKDFKQKSHSKLTPHVPSVNVNQYDHVEKNSTIARIRNTRALPQQHEDRRSNYQIEGSQPPYTKLGIQKRSPVASSSSGNYRTYSNRYSEVEAYTISSNTNYSNYGYVPSKRFGNHFRPWYGAGFGFGAPNTGFESTDNHLGTFLAGVMLWNLASNPSTSNYKVYYNSSNEKNANHNNSAKVSFNFENRSCVVIYNAEKFGEWAKRTINYIENQTDQTFPFGKDLRDVKFNFVIQPDKIIHNEDVTITCCGTETKAFTSKDILSGRDPNTNCVSHLLKIPFRNVKIVPLNSPLIFTKTDIEDFTKENNNFKEEYSVPT